MWGATLDAVAAAVLSGWTSSPDAARCSIMGRSAMALDLQALGAGLAAARPACAALDASDGRADADAALRRVDAFVKAYYVPWGPELRRWALSHPEVGRPAVAAVVAAVGEAAGVARRARAAFGAALDAELAAGE